jgi:hypothetical protein
LNFKKRYLDLFFLSEYCPVCPSGNNTGEKEKMLRVFQNAGV